MCPKWYLHCAIYGCICATHGARQRYSKKPTPQPRARTATAFRSSADRRFMDGQALQYFSSASLSLSSTGPASETTPPHRRCQDRFYRQTFPEAGSGPSRFREPHRFVVERDRGPSAPCGFAAEKKAWLGGPHPRATRFISNIASIGCSRKSSSRPMNFWCPKYVDQWDQKS
jgi:hypothetical protein